MVLQVPVKCCAVKWSWNFTFANFEGNFMMDFVNTVIKCCQLFHGDKFTQVITIKGAWEQLVDEMTVSWRWRRVADALFILTQGCVWWSFSVCGKFTLKEASSIFKRIENLRSQKRIQKNPKQNKKHKPRQSFLTPVYARSLFWKVSQQMWKHLEPTL